MHRKECVYKTLLEKNNLTKIERKVQKNILKYIKNLEKDLEKLQK